MNASEVIKAKQNRILYNTYYNPVVLESSITSTVRPVSTIYRYSMPGNIDVITNSYTSCVTTCNTYVSKPTFVSYDMMNAMRDGEYGCSVARRPLETSWKNTQSTTKIIQSTVYSTFSTTGPLLPSSVRYSSTVMMTGESPTICPLIDYHQGTSYSMRSPDSCVNYPNQSGNCC